jgi:hypothetical protein
VAQRSVRTWWASAGVAYYVEVIFVSRVDTEVDRCLDALGTP